MTGSLNLSPGASVKVQAHGQFRRDFNGHVVRTDRDNYLVWVRPNWHRPSRAAPLRGCTAMFVWHPPYTR